MVRIAIWWLGRAKKTVFEKDWLVVHDDDAYWYYI
jgi:hypothetical protein